MQLEGRWDLPSIERGVLSELAFNSVELPFGGRAVGISAEVEPRTLPVTVAGQAVQRSAYPDAYADDVPLAKSMLDDATMANPASVSDST